MTTSELHDAEYWRGAGRRLLAIAENYEQLEEQSEAHRRNETEPLTLSSARARVSVCAGAAIGGRLVEPHVALTTK